MSAMFARADARARRQPGRDGPGADHSRRRHFRPDRLRASSASGSRRRQRSIIPVLTRIPVHRHASCSGRTPSSTSRSRWSSAIWWFLYRTRAGLILRAVGDNHASAHALGYPVLQIRMLAVLFGGACAGLGGAYLPLAYTPFFIPGMTAGRGWIALALVVFASWRPGAAGGRRLSVRRGDDPAAPCAGLRARHSVAIDDVAAVSRDRHRAGADFARARTGGSVGAGLARHGVRAGPLKSRKARAERATRRC